MAGFFFFNDTATTEIYTLSLHDALPIDSGPKTSSSAPPSGASWAAHSSWARKMSSLRWSRIAASRSEEHTSELQSRQYLVCRLLLAKNKTPTMLQAGGH